MSDSLSNRTAFVTGSTRGLGKQIALSLAGVGYRVAMNYRSNHKVALTAFSELEAVGGEHCLVQSDVTDEAAIRDAIGEIESKLGGVDILVINATCEQPLKSIEEYEWPFFQRMVDFFMKSPFLLTKACLPHMRQQRWGRVIHITSEVFQGAWPNFCPYVSAKGGQIGLAKSSAAELATDGITVNMVAPGWIPVERHSEATEIEKQEYLATAPMGYFGKPQDVAQAVLYFASESAGFVTGASLPVNGGRTIG